MKKIIATLLFLFTFVLLFSCKLKPREEPRFEDEEENRLWSPGSELYVIAGDGYDLACAENAVNRIGEIRGTEPSLISHGYKRAVGK